ncbi:hypothetical protein B0H63DRAFT_394668 [Podospora didyma]|uniref:Uncharacterized protein n=1 Tax=Podospora didyma TaxID=330526 RepID=A0AAE0NNN5_9PEZI|nr:hypothetical protein B0H63DRAFT_394668 [Podospora didyma]
MESTEAANYLGQDVSGWVFDCGYRGTLDILYGCVVVLIAAVWTVVHLNVPAKGDSSLRTTLRKIRWGLVAIMAPDFLTLIAGGQWDGATKSVKQMKELTDTDEWTLEHAFYANSGGFVLQTPDTDEFPINAASVRHLVSRGYIKLPEISRDEIWDKSKADVFAKGLAMLQGGWIIIQAIARKSQNLPLVPLELFTLAFVVSTVTTYFFWWRKPQHVSTPTVIRCKVPMSTILADAGYPSDTPYADTPMDFVEKPAQFWVRRKMFVDFDLESGQGKKDPRQRIPDDSLIAVRLPTKMVIMLLIPSVAHSCIHLTGWNSQFPTAIEQNLWRTAVVVLAAMSSLSVGLVRILGIKGFTGRYNLVWVWVNSNATPSPRGNGSGKRRSLREWIPAPMDALLSVSVLLLVLARCFLIAEVFISLRQLPAEAYVDVSWTNFIPHM